MRGFHEVVLVYGTVCDRRYNACSAQHTCGTRPPETLTCACSGALPQVFLRAGQMAELDKLRTELLNRSAITLQRHARGFVARAKYARQRRAVITLQVSACMTLPQTTTSLQLRMSTLQWVLRLRKIPKS